jgi:hypothetical protein
MPKTVKAKPRCCQSRPRCKRCPIVCRRLESAGHLERIGKRRWRVRGKIPKKVLRKARRDR